MAKTLIHLSAPKRKNKVFLLFVLLAVAFSSCTVRPRSVLSQKKMADVLYDLHSAEGVLQVAGYSTGKDEELGAYYEAILMKHGTTQACFDSSIVWYTDNPKQFCIVYDRVVQRLKADKDREKEISDQISRRFFTERNTNICVDTVIASIPQYHPILSYIELPPPYEDCTIREEALDSTFRYVALPALQDSIYAVPDSVVLEATKKTALSKSMASEAQQDTTHRIAPKKISPIRKPQRKSVERIR